MAKSSWTHELVGSRNGSSTSQDSKLTRQRGNPVWAQLATIGIIVYALGWATRAFAVPGGVLELLHRHIGTYTTPIAVGIWGVAGVIFIGWLPGWFRRRSDTRASHEGTASAEEVAVAHELSLPTDDVTVLVRKRPQRARPFWCLRSVTVTLRRGRVTKDPSKRIAERLQPLLGEMHKHTWEPRKGRLVLTAGPGDADDGVDIPNAEVTPQKRAVQIAKEILKTDQLRPEDPQYDTDGQLTAFKMRHPTNIRIAGTDAEGVISERFGRMMPDAPGGRGWAVSVNAQRDYFLVRSRPQMPDFFPHPVLDYEQEFGEGSRFLPFGIAEGGTYAGWDISPTTKGPHCLLSGTTGSGKTSTMRSLVVSATRQSAPGHRQIEVWGLDPKMIELMGFDGWPGITRLAFTISELAALIDAAHAEMMARYTQIKDREIHPTELPVLLLLLDEFLILRAMLIRWWKEECGNRGQPPQLGQLQQLLALSRSAAVHLCVGIQRPDAANFDDGARDNMRTRAAHDQLSLQGRQMMWDDSSKGILTNTGVKGRIAATDAAMQPVETQAFWTPDLDQHPLARRHMSEADKHLIDSLRPAPYTPQSITASGLIVPTTNARDVPAGSVQSEMMDETADIFFARDLQPRDRIKYDKGGRWETAVVEENTYSPGDDYLDLHIYWDDGGAEVLSQLEENEEIYCLERADDT